MKLLIELDEDYVKAIDKIRFLVGGRTDRKLQLEIIKAIKNGKALEQEPTIDYRRAFKIACELLSGSVLYGIDSDKIFETAMQKDGLVSNESYERYILNHLQELDHGQYARVEE